ncbi:MAG TPA: Gfo/Idh/MocA family oxidoreductase [Chloroflexota bacterium]|jgi:predicted dehydrogenase|nr:Gfo/Idh/MocA family oxidoreductase [Chloroflexota bacterium]
MKMGTYRAGILGLTHDHIWHHVADLGAAPEVAVVHVADEHEDLLRKLSEQVEVGHTYATAEELLAHEQLDFVMIYADNQRSAALANMAMQRGIHVIVEKPMAATLQEADRMLTTAAGAGVKLMVNWPIAWNAAIRHALRLAAEGRIGCITHVEYRGAHAGPKEYGCSPSFYGWLYDAKRNGGGALIDYCSYGAMISRVMLGVPYGVTAVGGRFQKDYVEVEDNAVLLMRYPRAVGVAQASWSQIGPGRGAGPIIYGTTGTIIVHQRTGAREGHVVREGQVELMTVEQPEGTIIDPPELPAVERSAVAYFVDCLNRNAPVEGMVSAAVGRDVQEILEAGYQSLAAGQTVPLPLPVMHALHREA